MHEDLEGDLPAAHDAINPVQGPGLPWSAENPTLLHMLFLLSEEELNVGQLAKRVGLDRSEVSQHLLKLRAIGCVEARRSSQDILYVCRDEKVTSACRAIRSFSDWFR